jgi:hypothetical protein
MLRNFMALLLLASVARAEKNPLELLAEQGALLTAPDAGRVGEFFPGEGKRQQWTVLLEQGRCYVISGAAAGGAKKMAVYLWGPSGQRIIESRSPGLLAQVQHCASVTGMYKFEGKTAGNGPWVVGLYQKGAPRQKIKEVVQAPPPVAVAPSRPSAPPPPPAAPTCSDDGERGSGNLTISCEGVAIDVYFDGQFIRHAPGEMPIRIYDAGAGCHRVKVDCWKGVFKHGVVYEGPIKVYGYHEARYNGRPGALDLVGKSALEAPPPVVAAAPSHHHRPTVPAPPAQPTFSFSVTHSSSSSSSSNNSSNSDSPTPAARSRYQGEDGCDGDWQLGENAVINSRNPPGIECNSYSAPTNCPTGLYIQMRSQRKCYCVARCSDYNTNPAEGQACTADGSFVCDHYGSLSTTNHAVFCAPAAWNLCRK